MKTNCFVVAAGLLLAGLTHLSAQPIFISQPQDQSVSLGVDVFMYASAYGTSPVQYQWRKDGADLPGQTLEILIFGPVRPTDAGEYVMVAWNDSGAVTSQVARLTIDTAFTKVTTGPVVNDIGSATGGVWEDYDKDGHLDLFVPHDNNLNNALFRNRGDGTFESITSGNIVNDGGSSRGAAWGDANNDGYPDLFVANYSGQNEFFYQNNGKGGFTRVSTTLPTLDGGSTTGGAWADVDNDGLLDLLAVNAGFFIFNPPIFMVVSGTNFLYHNNGDGTFAKVANTPGNEESGGGGFNLPSWTAPSWADYDNDGRMDLLMLRNNSVSPALYRNLGNNQFVRANTDGFVESTGNFAAGAWGDYDNDGWLDLFLADGVSGSARLSPVYHNDGNGRLTRLTNGIITEHRGQAQGAAWADYDNDGWLDLFVTDASTNNTLYHNIGDGTFERVTTGSLVNDGSGSRGCAWADYDNDGFLDLFVANYLGGNLLYRNSANSNAWLRVQCVGRSSNRPGIGAKVRVLATIRGTNVWQVREITGGSMLGSTPLIASFGLGDAAIAETVRIEWPSGMVQELPAVSLRQTLVVTEPNVRVWPPNPGVVLGSDFELNVAGLEGTDWEYQWRFNGTNILDATNAMLRLSNVQSNHLGSYSVAVTAIESAVRMTTAPARLQVSIKPAFTRQPQPTNYLVSLGLNIALEPVVSGTGPLGIQWRWNDADLPGATNTTLSFTNVQPAQSGRYQLVVTNVSGAVTSQVVTIQVDAAFTKVLAGDIVNDGGASFGVGLIDLGQGPESGLLVINGGGQSPFLYQNSGSGAFARVPASQAPDLFADRGEAIGVAVGDYDNDGLDDVFVANSNARSNFLYHAEGGGAFTRVDAGEMTSLRANHWTAAWGDANKDGWLDLFVSAQGPDYYFENNRDGTFSRQTNSPVAKEVGNSRACTWSDYDNDGDLDLMVANLTSTNHLFQNNGDGTFAKVMAGRLTTDLAGGNGAAWGDYDNDGDLDLVLAKNGPDLLYENNGDGTFARITTGPVVNDTGNTWAVAWVDYDNDGWLDLYMANNGAKALFRNNGDRSFTRIQAGSLVSELGDARGCVWADFNHDGFADLFLSNYNTNNALYLNNGNVNHWLKVRCVGRGSAIGAKVRVLATIGGTNLWQMREITSGDGLGSRQSVALFGLGAATNVLTVRVEWPTGPVQEWQNVAADQYLSLAEPTPAQGPSFIAPRLVNGQLQFEFRAGSATQCVIQTSTNLRDWELWQPAGTDGAIAVPVQLNTPQRFYRAVGQ